MLYYEKVISCYCQKIFFQFLITFLRENFFLITVQTFFFKYDVMKKLLVVKNDERILIVNFQWYFFKKIFLNHIFFQIQCYIMKEKLFICCYCRKTIKESQPFNSQFSIMNIFCNRCDLSKNIWNVIRETFCFIIHSYESFLFFDSTIGRFEFGKVKHRGIWSCNGSFLEKFGCLCASTNVVL